VNQRLSKQDVLARVNLELKKKDQVLVDCQHLCRSCMSLGDYYLMDLTQNSLIDTHVDLEKFARQECCLADGEYLDA